MVFDTDVVTNKVKSTIKSVKNRAEKRSNTRLDAKLMKLNVKKVNRAARIANETDRIHDEIVYVYEILPHL